MMADEGKKVSFGFAKSIKKTALKVLPAQEQKKVDYIESFDGKSMKVIGEEEKIDCPLVIPLLGSKSWHNRILNKTDADIFEPKTKDKENGISMKIANGDTHVDDNGVVPIDVSRIKTEKSDVIDSVPKTLEEQAASEIIEDLHDGNVKLEDPNFQVPLTENESLRGEQEPTLEDYEQIPIDAFGLAMLRGMGWKPGKGIGKNEKLVTQSLPELRPRGMGLGADKVTSQMENSQPKSKDEEQLKLNKGTFVKIIAGKLANNYGEIEGFDDDAGRLIVKMSLSGESESLNECLVRPVTKSEFTKNSKVLNAAKYEEYKNKSVDKKERETRNLDDESSNEDSGRKIRDDEKNLKKNRKKSSKYTSDEMSTDSDRKTRKRKNSSESDRDRHKKKTKKSKKSRGRDDEYERTSKKSKKRDKTRHDFSVTSDRNKKHKRHKRSRSRSSARR